MQRKIFSFDQRGAGGAVTQLSFTSRMIGKIVSLVAPSEEHGSDVNGN